MNFLQKSVNYRFITYSDSEGHHISFLKTWGWQLISPAMGMEMVRLGFEMNGPTG